jgi:hypothetical protein
LPELSAAANTLPFVSEPDGRPAAPRRHPLTAGVVQGRLFVSSYAPLFAILAARTCPGIGDPHEPLWPFVAASVLAVWGLADGVWLIRGSLRRAAVRAVLLDVHEQGAAVAGYLPSYLLPFVAATPRSTGAWIGYGIYFAVLFVVFLGSDFALVNPTLYVLGHRVVRATLERQPVQLGDPVVREQILVVARQLPTAGDAVRLVRLAGCWVEKEAAGAG